MRCVRLAGCSDGGGSEGAAVGAGGGADHVWTASAPAGQDEGDQEDLQVCCSYNSTLSLMVGKMKII